MEQPETKKTISPKLALKKIGSPRMDLRRSSGQGENGDSLHSGRSDYEDEDNIRPEIHCGPIEKVGAPIVGLGPSVPWFGGYGNKAGPAWNMTSSGVHLVGRALFDMFFEDVELIPSYNGDDLLYNQALKGCEVGRVNDVRPSSTTFHRGIWSPFPSIDAHVSPNYQWHKLDAK
eukprot:Gb_37454 [translate_table: standard]